jgi:AcrR family transcriptional regulator
VNEARRRRPATALKRELILEAARRVFEAEGLEGASLRGIALAAGYTPAALYFHFDSKEALYAAVLTQSLAQLKAHVDGALTDIAAPADRFTVAALAFYDFYAGNPRDLDLGFYLFRGGMRPHGLGRERDEALNVALEATLLPIAEAARGMGASVEDARLVMADTFAHAAGVLLLAHTRRIRMFDTPPRLLMERHVADERARLEKR